MPLKTGAGKFFPITWRALLSAWKREVTGLNPDLMWCCFCLPSPAQQFDSHIVMLCMFMCFSHSSWILRLRKGSTRIFSGFIGHPGDLSYWAFIIWSEDNFNNWGNNPSELSEWFIKIHDRNDIIINETSELLQSKVAPAGFKSNQTHNAALAQCFGALLTVSAKISNQLRNNIDSHVILPTAHTHFGHHRRSLNPQRAFWTALNRISNTINSNKRIRLCFLRGLLKEVLPHWDSTAALSVLPPHSTFPLSF